MSCGRNQNIIENYGDVHLHTGPYPIPVNEAERQNCDGACYYGESRWPQQEALANSINQPQPAKLVAINHSPDPAKRYALVPAENVGGEIGVGCMNTRCMCSNCHGSCNCSSVEPNIEEQLMYNKEIKEPFEIFGLNIPMPKLPVFARRREQFTVPFTRYEIAMEEKSIAMIITGIILFLAWYYMNKN